MIALVDSAPANLPALKKKARATASVGNMALQTGGASSSWLGQSALPPVNPSLVSGSWRPHTQRVVRCDPSTPRTQHAPSHPPHIKRVKKKKKAKPQQEKT